MRTVVLLLIVQTVFTYLPSTNSAQTLKQTVNRERFVISPESDKLASRNTADSAEKKPKTHSKTVLKERIGEKVEKLLKKSASLNKKSGWFQIQRARLERKLLKIGKNVIENRKPIKMATQKNLQEGVKVLEEGEKVLTKISEQLKEQSRQIKSMLDKIDNTKVLKTSAIKFKIATTRLKTRKKRSKTGATELKIHPKISKTNYKK